MTLVFAASQARGRFFASAGCTTGCSSSCDLTLTRGPVPFAWPGSSAAITSRKVAPHPLHWTLILPSRYFPGPTCRLSLLPQAGHSVWKSSGGLPLATVRRWASHAPS